MTTRVPQADAQFSVVLKETARALGCDEDKEQFEATLGKIATARMKGASVSRNKVAGHKLNVCPECDHVFQGDGWVGIDAHWKSKHEHVMPYAEAWPLI